MAVLLRSIIDADHAPLYGFDEFNDGDDAIDRAITLSRVSGGSPAGTDSLRWVGIGTGANLQFDCYFYFASSLPTVPQGSVRYLRYRLKIRTPVSWASDFNGTNANSAGGKMVILGNTGGSNGRIIHSIGAPFPERNQPYVDLDENVNGLGISASNLTLNVWHHLQMRLQSSSTSVATDGALALYVDNNVEGSPTDSASGFDLPTASWGDTQYQLTFGFAAFNELANGGSFDVEMADFEYADSFDSGWALSPNPKAGFLRR